MLSVWAGNGDIRYGQPTTAPPLTTTTTDSYGRSSRGLLILLATRPIKRALGEDYNSVNSLLISQLTPAQLANRDKATNSWQTE